MNKRIRILIADDQARTRQSLRALLATWPQAQEIREAANGLEAVREAEEHTPDVVLMDVRMPEMDGIEATRQIKARWPQVRVIVLSMYSDLALAAMAAEADAFVSKGESPEKLLATLTAMTTNPAQCPPEP